MVSFILPGNSASTGYEVANSLRFDDASSDYLSFEASSASNRRTWTLSFWTKRANLGKSGLFGGWTSGNYQGGFASMIYFNSSDQLEFDNDIAGQDYTFNTDMRFRDVSAWYHIVIAIDTTQSTEANRQKIYVNGSQVSLTETALGFPTQNFDTYFNNALTIVSSYAYEGGGGTVDEYSGYMAEVVMVDGQQLDATSFGEFDSNTNIWKPIDVSGLTFGTNGFYLEFKQTGTSQNSSGMGADTSGNDNHFAVSNLTSIDQSLDTCTNNYTVLNPFLMSSYETQLSDGNLQTAASDGRGRFHNIGTIGFSSGKYYAEFKMTGGTYQTVGVATDASFTTASTLIHQSQNYLGQSNSLSYIYYVADGDVWANGTITSVGDTLGTNDILGVYVDLDNHKLYFSKNGTLQSSTGISLPTGYTYFFAVGDLATASTATVSCNFGSPAYSISSSNTDDNGHGNFEYSPNITGDGSAKSFYALNTKNLAEFG